MITQTYNLNMVPGGVPVHVYCSQRDDASRTVVFNMFNGSVPFAPENATARIDGTRPDGGAFSAAANLSGSAATWTIPLDATAVPGAVKAELVVVSGGAVLGSANFIIDVEAYAKDPDTPVTPEETSIWEQMYNQTSALVERAETAADSSASSASASAASAQEAADSAEDAAESAEKAVTYALTLNMTNNVISLVGSDSSVSSITLPVYSGGVS